MMRRLPVLVPEEFSPAQEAFYAEITEGRRGSGWLLDDNRGLVGPFNAWAYSPEIGGRVQKLGEAVRFDHSLPPNLIEIAILVTAREWRAQFEWWAHARLARRAGVAESVIDSLHDGLHPAFDDLDEELVYDFATEMLTERRVSAATYTAAVDRFSERGVVDLVLLLGYYGLVSMTLNAFEVPLPPGFDSPFDESAPPAAK